MKHPLLEIVFYISVTTSVVWLGDWELFYDVRHGTLPGDLFITKFSLVGLMVQLSRSHILSKRMLKLPTSRDVNYVQRYEAKLDALLSLSSCVYPCLISLVQSFSSNKQILWWWGEKARNINIGVLHLTSVVFSQRYDYKILITLHYRCPVRQAGNQDICIVWDNINMSRYRPTSHPRLRFQE